MRRIFTGLLAGVVACLISCDKTEEGNKWFSTPQYVVNGTTVEMSCQTQFGPGVLSASNAGFSYAPVVGEGVVEFKKASGVTVDGSTLHATLSGLAPQTVYVAYAYADLGAGQMQSVGISFQTGEGGSLPEPDPENPTFGTPWASDVTASSAMLNCGFTFEEATSSYTLCFEYRPVSGGSYTQKSVPSGTGSKSVLLTGLSASTEYEFRLCCEWDGESYTSDSGRFTTSASQGGGDGGDGGDNNPTGALSKYTGWAELPAMAADAEGLYYAAHFCEGLPGGRNYSVCYDSKRRSGLWVAFPIHTCYKGSQKRTDAWAFDPGIPSSVQPNLVSGSYQGQSGYSRGHLLASSDRTFSYKANAQTFYVTNMAPQWQTRFNDGVWNSLETACWKAGNVCADTLYVVSGVWYENDLKTVEDQSGQQSVVPTHFYRVLLRSKDGNTGRSVRELPADELQCVGFWFENRTYSSSTLSTYMTSVADIEAKTNQRFFVNVPQAPKSTYSASDWAF